MPAEPKKRGRPRKTALPAKGVRKPTLAAGHRAIVDAWFVNGCVSKRRAMHACGYSVNTAWEVFNREDVKDEIKRRQDQRRDRADVTEARITAELAKLAFTNMGDLLEVNEDGSAYLDLNSMTDAHRAALVEYQSETYTDKVLQENCNEVSHLLSGDTLPGNETNVGFTTVKVLKSKIKFASKQAALDSLARILGMFKDKVEVSGVTSLVDRVAAARKRLNEDAKV